MSTLCKSLQGLLKELWNLDDGADGNEPHRKLQKSSTGRISIPPSIGKVTQ